jgi:hypothetical protein
MDKMYHVAALLREAPFTIGPQVNRESICSDKSLWFNETVDELVRRLHSFSMESILTHIKKIPAHRRPAYNSKSVCKTLNSLIDHILRRVSHLFDLQMAPLCELVLALFLTVPHSNSYRFSPQNLKLSAIKVFFLHYFLPCYH